MDVFYSYIIKSFSTNNLNSLYIKLSKRSKNKIISFDDVLIKVQEIKKRGYSYEEDDVRSGSLCIAEPIFNKDNILIGVLSINGLKSRLNNFP
ncbi:IclR family transcriptional regulator domain-containing protein [Maledivibacter halophilus]|uniref:IclR family transcriptional regulator domain-containing protein n=1 Tax=Maledivibacter halophilus TaxID=36842 RepID=UPI0009A57547|nr:IclR family transcriptional regulator C-terminal domain-containing protein [Maledivibacter halophilus]